MATIMLLRWEYPLVQTYMKEVIMRVPEDVFQKRASSPVPPARRLPDFSEFMTAVEEGRINRQVHPTEPYSIFKYGKATQWTRDWDDVTQSARGIIFNHDTGEIVARPFTKFFNHNEPLAPVSELHGAIEVSEKLDGSLGIGYETVDGRFSIATGGSFASTQAARANAIYQEKYDGKWERNRDLTYMWEIILPENRIVVHYGDEEDLHLIGAVNRATGKTVPLSQITEWPWKKAEQFTGFEDLADVTSSGERSNREGFIVHFLDTDTRVKFKHDEYVALHRNITGVTTLTLWKLLRNNGNIEQLRMNAEEEFLDFIDKNVAELQAAYDEKIASYEAAHAEVRATLPEFYSQKDFATTLARSEVPRNIHPQVLNIENHGGADVNPRSKKRIWDTVKPEEAGTVFWNDGKKQ